MSHRARLAATPLIEPEISEVDVEIVRAVMARQHVQVQDFARNAGASRSQVSEALNSVPGRNISFRWVLKQDELFVRDVLNEIEKRLRLSPQAQREESFEALVAVLRAIWFRERAS